MASFRYRLFMMLVSLYDGELVARVTKRLWVRKKDPART